MSEPPVLQVVGYKKSGKTTLLNHLLQHLKHKHQWNIACLKHDMHGFQMDREGTDTYRFRQSGADLSLIQSPTGIGLTLTPKEPAAIEQLIHWLELIQAWDCFLIEGYKSADFTKLVLIRSVDDLPLLSTLTHIKWVLFQQEADFQYYQGLSEYNQLKEKGVVLKPMTQSAEMIGILEDWLLRQAYKTKE